MKEKPDNFLLTANVSYWAKRIKFTTPLKYIYFIIYGLTSLTDILFLRGIAYYLSHFGLDIINVAVFYFFLFLSNKLYNNFPELINRLQKERVLSPEIFNDYKELVINKFKSKIEIIFPLIFGLFGVGFAIITGFLLFADYRAGSSLIFVILYSVLLAIAFFLVYIIAFSGFILLIIMYRCLNKLGKKTKYPLNIEYKHLKTGVFNEIGKFLIGFTIPTIILGTILGLLGLVYIFLFKLEGAGFIYIIMGLVLAILMVLLLLINTMNIHNAIVDAKSFILERLANDIQIMEAKSESEIELHQKYEALINMVNYYDDVESITDWPFSLSSVIKLLFSLGSAIVPLILSFFGLG